MSQDPRRSVMHAAVAAGGASAVLMSAAVHQRDGEVAVTAGVALDTLLRAVVHTIEASASLPGEEQGSALADVVRDFLDLPAIGAAGRCRICGCVEQMACTESKDGEWFGPCGWADATQTLCDNPDCLAAAGVQAEAPGDPLDRVEPAEDSTA